MGEAARNVLQDDEILIPHSRVPSKIYTRRILAAVYYITFAVA